MSVETFDLEDSIIRPKRRHSLDSVQPFTMIDLDQVSVGRGGGYSVKELRQICRQMNISSRGLKVELALRIRRHHAQTQPGYNVRVDGKRFRFARVTLTQNWTLICVNKLKYPQKMSEPKSSTDACPMDASSMDEVQKIQNQVNQLLSRMEKFQNLETAISSLERQLQMIAEDNERLRAKKVRIDEQLRANQKRKQEIEDELFDLRNVGKKRGKCDKCGKKVILGPFGENPHARYSDGGMGEYFSGYYCN